MNRILILVMALMLGFGATAQQKMSCCALTSSTTQFAAMASDKNFIALHANPLPFQYEEELGRNISFKTPDGKKGFAFEIISNYESDKYLFIFHEWWGLNDYIKREAARYFKELKDVNVVVIDLYDGKVATKQDEAVKYMQGVTEERATAIIKGAIKHAGKDAKITTLGWCFGGGWSLQASILAGKQAQACVMYYGMPEKDVEKLKTLQCDVLGIFGTQDTHITPDLVVQFQKDMETAGKTLTLSNFDNEHAFANPSNPNYDKEAALKAYKQSVNFLKLHLSSFRKKGQQ